MENKATLKQITIALGYTHALSLGKYTRWSTNLNADNVEALLQAIGQYGSEIRRMIPPDGSFPVLSFVDLDNVNPRLRFALQCLAEIQIYGQLEWSMPSGWEQWFSNHNPAFTAVFSKRLTKNPKSDWAQGLSERAFALLLWMVGEFSMRAGPCLPSDYLTGGRNSLEVKPVNIEPAQEALVKIIIIVTDAFKID